MPARFTIPCSHLLEPHVVYDKAGSGYRAQLRCRCYKVIRLGRRVRERFAEAEAEAGAMLARRESDIARKRRDRLEEREAKRQTMHAIVVPCPTVPAVEAIRSVNAATPTPTPDRAWVLYWRGLCARHGHASRLT